MSNAPPVYRRGRGRGSRGTPTSNRSHQNSPSSPSPQQGDNATRTPYAYRGGRGSARGTPNIQSPYQSGSSSPARPPVDNAPQGICRFYWSTGSCNRGFDCTFKHQTKPNVIEPSANVSSNLDDVPDFFSADGLALNNGSVRSAQYAMKPSEAHNHIKPFLRDHYAFDSASRVEGFTRIFASISGRNQSWDTNSSQAFLDSIVNGNALLRLGDVLRYTPVVTNTGGENRFSLSFQRGYFPVLEYFSSDLILKTTMHHNINALYTVIDNNYDAIQQTIQESMSQMVDSGNWEDTSPGLPEYKQSTLDGVVVFKSLVTLFSQYFQRFKSAIKNHPQILALTEDLNIWFVSWSSAVSATPPAFKDPITSSLANVRELTINQIRQDVDRLVTIVRRESGVAERQRRPAIRSGMTAMQRHQALVTRLHQTYDPPGILREGEQPRHDNDCVHISDIRIAPTHEELRCPLQPYLPKNLPDAPHHEPGNSMERHIDIQFRLLREDFISPIRQSLDVIHDDLEIIWSGPARRKREPTKLEDLIAKGGGTYRSSGMNSVFFHLYSNVSFLPAEASRRTFTIGLQLDTPPGTTRDSSAKKRSEYWEHSKRLQSGSLVALVLVMGQRSQIFLGIIASYADDIAQSAKASAEAIQIRVTFFDAEVDYLALQRESITVDGNRFAFLVDNNVMFESVKPFLETLQETEPTSIPFSRYISSGDQLQTVSILPPRYARVPGFKYQLQCLALPGEVIHPMSVQDPNSIVTARRALHRFTCLDASQVEAVMDVLTREVSLIQGPPGTGKSFTGKELLRVLFASKIKPIVLIAYTNHALDHMLLSILEANITTNLVRLGSRSTDERIAEYNLAKLEKMAGNTELKRTLGREYGNMMRAEEEMNEVMNSIQLPEISWKKLEEFLDIHYPDHAERLKVPPYWISRLFEQTTADEAEHGKWQTAGKNKSGDKKEIEQSGIYGFWRRGRDVEFIMPPPQQLQLPVKQADVATDKAKGVLDPRTAFFASLGFDNAIPPVPSSDRSTGTLIDISNVWSMSFEERNRLASFWENEIRSMAYESNLWEFKLCRIRYKEACRRYNDVKDESRLRLLSKTDLIGCTTTGAAKLISLLKSIGPKVLVVEEAGQVLEAHILSSLVPSVEHLICIGDPQQLRPTLATYALSMDSESGRQLYKFDRSLMERLADNGMPMSQINVQRRMRPTISHFPRIILYPKLQDHDVVRQYPPVHGVQKDVYFFTHTNKENGEADSVSKYNKFEVEMIRDLVLYFLKQGPYNGAGDIAVLCAYLGQLQKVRAALRDLRIAVAVDERDEDQLARQGDEDESGFDQVLVTKHIRLGTVDTFQGEEAKIVIVSLVRNSGSFDGSSSIGFLKSINRVNVALSRAKHGLYILGNASNLMQNPTWSSVIKEMEDRDQIGPGLPTVCARHPEQTRTITKPGQLPTLAPEGGCLLPCTSRLGCGHNCPSVCHLDLDNHKTMKCDQLCLRISCRREHPCPRRCSEPCGDCEFPIYDVGLPCGHQIKSVQCFEMERLDCVKCKVKVKKRLPHCEHTAMVSCFQNPATVQCNEPCGGTMTCCSRACKSKCYQCQKASTSSTSTSPSSSIVERKLHKSHRCERLLYCQHLCGLDCSEDHACNAACSEDCRQRCAHHNCSEPCSKPCAPCMEPCQWRCPHNSDCPVVCGSICSRLPCDQPCHQELKCGHPCPSICGEPCEKQACVICLPEERKGVVADFIMQRTISELDTSSEDVSERTITLTCGHIFTVETLDGHCGMSDYYEQDGMGKYTATKVPPINYQTPPSCPTCRGSISALRYGRILKRANLDILEQNVASTMSHALEQVSDQMQLLSSDSQSSQDAAKKLLRDDGHKLQEDFERLQHDRESKYGKHDEPLPSRFLSQAQMVSTHGLAVKEAQAWNTIVRDILRAYKKVEDVAKKRGPHVLAYHAALSTLYRMELLAVGEDAARAGQAPEPLAMKEVNKKIGQPPHKADTRFQIEAYLLSIELRFMLAQIAQSRFEGLGFSEDPALKHHRLLWYSFVDFLNVSCCKDSEKTFMIATRSSASRQAARCMVYKIRSSLEQYRFVILDKISEMARLGQLNKESRQELAADAKLRQSVADRLLKEYQTAYLRLRPSQNMEQLRSERKWFNDNCGAKVHKYLKEYDGLVEHIMTDKGYRPLSLQEREDIVKAFGFTHRGHFYNCENGHTFVITECGGATEQARCPECSAPIGGSGHQLLSSNNRAMEFEEVARAQGVQDAPWTWGRGA